MASRGVRSHRCPSCGRRTYRKPRRLLADFRCARCVELGYWPRSTDTDADREARR